MATPLQLAEQQNPSVYNPATNPGGTLNRPGGTPQVATGASVSFPQTNLQPGQTSPAVKQLQEFLISQGIPISAGATGYYGTQTQAAVKAWQEKNGVDNSTGPGYWGPRSIAVASGMGGAAGAGGATNNTGKTDQNQPLTDAEYDAGVTNNPINQARIAKGNTAEMLAYAASTGDLSNLVDEYGQPFSLQQQQDALKQGMEDNRLFYEAQQSNEKAQAEASLAQKQADYQNFLLTSGQNFAQDKATLDQNAADTGMLFSTGRNQKEQKLQQTYQQDQAYKQASVGRDIGNIAQSYQYQYGNDSANGLSQYYNLGSNQFNPNVATGGVTSGGLSSIYNPNQYNFQGTQNVARKAAANVRAAGYLTNRGNKLLSTGYLNQL